MSINKKSFIQILDTCCKLVDSELDRTLNYTESNYQNALLHMLRSHTNPNTILCKEVSLTYKLSDGFVFGSGRIDILCETSDVVYILELKNNVDCKWLKKFTGQTLRYVKHYNTLKKRVGILIIFGTCSPIIKLLP